MGLFDLIKSNAKASFEKELPNRDLLYISYDKEIPSVNRGLIITIGIDSNGKVVIDDKTKQLPDPSTIYVNLPISEDYNVAKLPYWPHYIELTSGQRYKYLCWLRNVAEPTDMGFVFLYYYGLERQLLVGNFDKAFDEIIKLRNSHENRSFQKYSENALVHSAIMRNRMDRLTDLHEKTEISGYSNAMFLLAYNSGLKLGIDQLLLIFYKAFTTSRKPIKEHKVLFVECMTEILNKRFDITSFDIKDYDISKVKTIVENRFANYSFPEEIQRTEIIDFYQCKPLMEDLKGIFDETYDLFKLKNKMNRSNKTPEEIQAAIFRKNENRYKKLLKEKKINQSEFELLMKYNDNQKTDKLMPSG